MAKAQEDPRLSPEFVFTNDTASSLRFTSTAREVSQHVDTTAQAYDPDSFLAGLAEENISIREVEDVGMAETEQFDEFLVQQIIDTSDKRVVGMITANPRQIGALMLGLLLELQSTSEPIIVGVYPHKSDSVHELLAYVKEIQTIDIERVESTDEDMMIGHTLYYTGEGAHFTVHVALVESIDFVSGQTFAKQLKAFAF